MSGVAGSGRERAIPRPLLVGACGYVLAYVCWQMFRAGGGGEVIGDLAFVPLTILAMGVAWQASRRTLESRTSSAWMLVVIALGSYCVGDVAQAIYESGGKLPNPSLADLFYLAFYPLFFAALLRFPVRQTTKGARIRVLLDAITVTVSGSSLVWYLVLGPTATESTGSLVEKLVASAYPASDFLLVAGLVHMLLRTSRVARATFWLLGSGVMVYLVADVIYVRLELTGSYSGGNYVDTLWIAATALFAFAAACQPDARRTGELDVADRRSTPDFDPERGWTVYALPYLAVAGMLALLIGTQANDAFYPGLSLTLAAAAVGVLVLIRQFLAHRELSVVHAELSEAHDRLAALATTDPLTSLPNHRALVDAIDRELDRSARYERTCGVLFVDIDFFKTLNDTHGHAAGDTALHDVSELMRGSLRAIDTLGRWGGEEFVAVLPESDSSSTMAAAERIRKDVAEQVFLLPGRAHLTVSIGVSVFPRDGTGRDELLEAADRAMYTAKRMGRNQSLSAADPVVTAVFAADNPLAHVDEGAMMSAVDALAALVDAREEGAARHSDQVAALARQVALKLGCGAAQAQRVYVATRLHDIGKVAIAESILRKPGRLTSEEWELMRQHPVIGAEVIARMGSLASLAEIIRSHHERFDGQGYPDGLKGADIPLEARIVGVADAYDAMTRDRPYRARLDLEQVRRELQRGAGTQFDPDVIAALERVLAQRDVAVGARGRPDRPAPARRGVASDEAARSKAGRAADRKVVS